jgi:hypothetical protein
MLISANNNTIHYDVNALCRAICDSVCLVFLLWLFEYALRATHLATSTGRLCGVSDQNQPKLVPMTCLALAAILALSTSRTCPGPPLGNAGWRGCGSRARYGLRKILAVGRGMHLVYGHSHIVLRVAACVGRIAHRTLAFSMRWFRGRGGRWRERHVGSITTVVHVSGSKSAAVLDVVQFQYPVMADLGLGGLSNLLPVGTEAIYDCEACGDLGNI